MVTSAWPRSGRRGRPSPWRDVVGDLAPVPAAGRYLQVVEYRARAADLVVVGATAREDLARLATALRAVLALHHVDGRRRCAECSQGPWLVDWPCRTYRAVATGLRDGWPGAPGNGQGDR